MRTIQSLTILLCLIGFCACGGARNEVLESYNGATLPFQSKDVLGWRYDLIAADHTFSVRFAGGGMAPGVTVSNGIVNAPLYKWHIDDSDCLVLSAPDGLTGVYQLLSMSQDKVNVWDKITHQAMEFTRIDTD